MGLGKIAARSGRGISIFRNGGPLLSLHAIDTPLERGHNSDIAGEIRYSLQHDRQTTSG